MEIVLLPGSSRIISDMSLRIVTLRTAPLQSKPRRRERRDQADVSVLRNVSAIRSRREV